MVSINGFRSIEACSPTLVTVCAILFKHSVNPSLFNSTRSFYVKNEMGKFGIRFGQQLKIS